MASFPAPHLESQIFTPLPAEGTPLTEHTLLQILYDILCPLEAITYAFELAHGQMGEGVSTTRLVQLIEEKMYRVVALLDAWHDHQAAPTPEEGV